MKMLGRVNRWSNKALVFFNKTSNLYKLDKDEYKKLTKKAVASTYKRVHDKTK